jgi:hypothetical protein
MREKIKLFIQKVLLHQFNLAIPDKEKWIDEKTTELFSQIKEELRKKMPEPKEGIKFDNYSKGNVNHFSFIDNQKVGFNDCLSQVLKLVDELT